MRIASLTGPLMIDCEEHRRVAACRQDRPPFGGNIRQPDNIGDWFVTRATRQMLGAEAIYNIHPAAPDHEFDIVNRECAALVLKGGNFLSGNWLAENITYDVLKKIHIPIVYIGAGIQAPIGGGVTFTQEEARCLKYIHDSSALCGVRGEYTKEVLEKIGITNSIVMGCPTLFWSMKPQLRIKPHAFGKVGWTMRAALLSLGEEGHRKQFELIRAMRDRVQEFTVMLQGEEVPLQEAFMYYRWGRCSVNERTPVEGSPTLHVSRHVPVSEDILQRNVLGAYGHYADSELLQWLMRHTFFSYDIAEYLDFMRSRDMVIGCRLHGNLVSLSQGVPAFYFTYDNRTQEMVELFNIPHAKIMDFSLTEDSFNVSWDGVEKAYAFYYQQLVQLFEKNNIKHRLAI